MEAAGKGSAQPAAASTATTASAAAEPRKAQSLAQMGIPDGSYDLIPLDGMKKAVARRMVDSVQNVPHFPLFIDVEIDQLMAVRAKVNKMLEPQGIKVSVNDFVIKAAALALKAVPEANASYTPEGIAMHHNADVSMAVAIDGGPDHADHQEGRDQGSGADRHRVQGSGQARPRPQAEAGRVPGRHLLGVQPGHVRHQAVHLDHQ